MTSNAALIDKAELAARLQCSPRHLEHLIRDHKIHVIKVGRLARFSWPRVERDLERLTRKALGE